MQIVFDMLAADPGITTVSFNVHPFWGGYQYVSDGWYWRRGSRTFHRLFKWAPGYQYQTHQPPTVVDERGRNLRRLRWIDGDEMARRGVRLYHYDHVFPLQIRNKALFYRRQAPHVCADINGWARDSYFTLRRPYHVERHYWLPAWIERYDGPHPPEALRLLDDISSGRLDVELRPTDDVERLLRSPRYRAGRAVLKALFPADQAWRWTRRQAGRATRAPDKLARTIGVRQTRPGSDPSAVPPERPAKGGTT